MVCFVHDRQFLSKFHAAVNQLRQTNECTVLTLRQLPKRCCSCPEKRNNLTSTAVQPQLTSEDIDAIQLFCLQFELQQYVATNALSEPSKILHYTVLPFPVLVNAKVQENITDQFIFQQQNQLYSLEKMHHVRLEFVTSTTPEELLKEVVHIQWNLVAKCSDYLQAIQAINGLWVIISAEDQSRVDLVKHALQQQWTRFITSIDMYQTSATYNGLQNLLRKVTNKKNSNRQRAEIKRQKMLEKRIMVKPTWRHIVSEIRDSIEDQREEPSDYLVEDLLIKDQKLTFLHNRFQNCNKTRPPRTHRRQHLLALAMVA